MAEFMNVILTSTEQEETDVVHGILHANLPASTSAPCPSEGLERSMGQTILCTSPAQKIGGNILDPG